MQLTHRKLNAKHMLERNGYTQSRLAEELGVSVSAINQAILGRQKSARVARAFRRITGRDLCRVLEQAA